MSALEILNEMARSDGERPFVSAEIENESDVLFRSFSDAQKAFQFTDEIKSKISIQVAETNVPAEWTEMINAYPETKSSVGVRGQEGSTFLSRILASFGANRGAWGGGFATACLVLILIDPSGESSLYSNANNLCTRVSPSPICFANPGSFQFVKCVVGTR